MSVTTLRTVQPAKMGGTDDRALAAPQSGMADEIPKPENSAPASAKSATGLYVGTVAAAPSTEEAFPSEPSETQVRQNLNRTGATFLARREGEVWAKRFIHRENDLDYDGFTEDMVRDMNDQYAAQAAEALSKVAVAWLEDNPEGEDPTGSDGDAAPDDPEDDGADNSDSNTDPRGAGTVGMSQIAMYGTGLLVAGGGIYYAVNEMRG